jgi:hypothetical protein
MGLFLCLAPAFAGAGSDKPLSHSDLNRLLARWAKTKGYSEPFVYQPNDGDNGRLRFRLDNGGEKLSEADKSRLRDVIFAISQLWQVPPTFVSGAVGRCHDLVNLVGFQVEIKPGVFCEALAFTEVETKPKPAQGLVTLNESTSFDQIAINAEKFFNAQGVDALISSKSDLHFVIGAYGLRNAVVPGVQLWERVQFFVTIASTNNVRKLSIVADGFYTGGLGKAPPVTSYTNPFEPRYLLQLEDFARKFGNYIIK